MLGVKASYNFALKKTQKNKSSIYQEFYILTYTKLKEKSEPKNSKHEIQNLLDLEHIIFSM